MVPEDLDTSRLKHNPVNLICFLLYWILTVLHFNHSKKIDVKLRTCKKDRLKIFSYYYHCYKICIIKRMNATVGTTFSTSSQPDQILYGSFFLPVQWNYISQPPSKITWDIEIEVCTWYNCNEVKYLPQPSWKKEKSRGMPLWSPCFTCFSVKLFQLFLRMHQQLLHITWADMKKFILRSILLCLYKPRDSFKLLEELLRYYSYKKKWDFFILTKVFLNCKEKKPSCMF